MVASLNIGVIGLGRMGQFYVRALATRISGVWLYVIASLEEQARSHACQSESLKGADLCPSILHKI